MRFIVVAFLFGIVPLLAASGATWLLPGRWSIPVSIVVFLIALFTNRDSQAQVMFGHPPSKKGLIALGPNLFALPLLAVFLAIKAGLQSDETGLVLALLSFPLGLGSAGFFVFRFRSQMQQIDREDEIRKNMYQEAQAKAANASSGPDFSSGFAVAPDGRVTPYEPPRPRVEQQKPAPQNLLEVCPSCGVRVLFIRPICPSCGQQRYPSPEGNEKC